VLLDRATAEGIADGTVTLVLRRWDAPRAKPGGTQRTPAGTIRVDEISEHPGRYRVTAAQARAAGYPDAKTAQTAVDAGEADAAAALWAEDGTYDVEGWSMRGRAEVAPRSPRWCAPPNIRA